MGIVADFKYKCKFCPELKTELCSTRYHSNGEILPGKECLYSCGRSAISISWSDLPLVSTTFLFTKTTAIKQKVQNIEYKSCGPSCSSKRRKSKPTKKFITWRRQLLNQMNKYRYQGLPIFSRSKYHMPGFWIQLTEE